MTPDRVVGLFRQHAGTIALEEAGPMLSNVIEELARLLSESHDNLPEETFERLIRIGGVLYREGNSQYQAKSDVDAIMRRSSRS
ncbi:hypothetical protein [Noviherbaspirillum denitrificans]|uniref:Uncharacterized protein n=1 Tax=Noviherbaspirillum denitrificans TaxID=1968433 RepID=A0A254T9K3_9BURK|nr:hypothetical protein [Noviherbaspirillum denitrificans]OWW19331.1 hypothetical protein AYR66_07260 [Noviherbaspirillum denitrificans]